MDDSEKNEKTLNTQYTDKRKIYTHHHKFVDAPLIDSEPLDAHCFHERPEELNTHLDVREAMY